MSAIFDFIVDPLSLSLSPIWEWLILLIIGEISYRVAFYAVGNLYRDGWITGSGAGSILHWLIRLPVYVFIWLIIEAAIEGIKWVSVNKKILLIIGSAALLILIIYFLVIRLKNKNEQEASNNGETDEG